MKRLTLPISKALTVNHPILTWGHSVTLLKLSVKIADILISDAHCNFFNLKICLHKIFRRLLKPLAHQKLLKCTSSSLLNDLTKSG